MANVKISALPASVSVAIADKLPVVSGGVTSVATFTMVRDAVLTAAVFLSFGALPSATGVIRMSNNTGIVTRNVADSGDIPTISVSSGNDITIGAYSASNAYISAQSTVGLAVGAYGGYVVKCTGTETQIGLPIVGNGTPYSAHSVLPTVALTIAQNITLSSSQYNLTVLKFNTAATGACTVTLPAKTDAAGYIKYIWHVSGTGTLAVSNGTVTIAAALAPGTGAWFLISAAGVTQLTVSFAVIAGV